MTNDTEPTIDVDALAAATVLDSEGRSVGLGSLWAERTAVLVFLREFG